MMHFLKHVQVLLISIFILHGCARKIPTYEDISAHRSELSSKSMLYSSFQFSQVFTGDALKNKGLADAIEQSLVYLKRVPDNRKFKYGKLIYTANELRYSLKMFSGLLKKYPREDQFVQAVEKHFNLFSSSANDGDGVLFTGYYEPIYQGGLKKTKEYKVPVYSLPDNLTRLELGPFRKDLKNRTIVYRIDRGRIRPFYSRAEIMRDKVLRKKAKVIAWMKDPVDLFFLQVQGSGILSDSFGTRLKISYAGANGRPYKSIGRYLVDEGLMEMENVSMGSIRSFMKQNPELRDKILYHNPSYVFFKINKDNTAPKGNINVPLSPRRSIATDTRAFPKGGLAYIRTKIPAFDKDWNHTHDKVQAQFVLNQDTGGAIRGPNRVDLFWGNGPLAENSAGTMKHYGMVYFLVAKKDAIIRFRVGKELD